MSGRDLVIEAPDARLDGVPAIRMFGDSRHRTASQRLGPHYNDGIEICLARAGVYRWDVEGTMVEIRPGELSVTRPWERHSGHDNVLGPGRLTWIVIAAHGSSRIVSPELRAMLGAEAETVIGAFNGGGQWHLGHVEEAVRAMDRIREELAAPGPGRTALIAAELVRLVVHLARTLDDAGARAAGGGPCQGQGVAGSVPDQVLSVLRRVRDEPDRGWTTPELAGDAGLGVTAFTEWCKRATGRPPRWYVLEQRLERARRLLATTDSSVMEISLECGFASSQHFASAFRKLFGESPSAYRRRL